MNRQASPVPARFLERCRPWLSNPEDTGRLRDSLQNPPPPAVRFNPAHVGILPHAERVPWSSGGRFWPWDSPPSSHPDHLLGRYYIQEASAMMPTALLEHFPGLRPSLIVDLAAAPGGKTTALADLFPDSMILANEVHPQRRTALVWNLVRHRLFRSMVTGMAVENLSRLLPEQAGLVLLDAPCTGEGLSSLGGWNWNRWSPTQVRRSSARQRPLLEAAVRLLAPGGYLLYSTCTFGIEENEEQISWILDRTPLQPVTLPATPELSAAWTQDPRVHLCSRRVLPHLQKGAGAFAALLKREDPSSCPPPVEDTWPLPTVPSLLVPERPPTGTRYIRHRGRICLFPDQGIPSGIHPHLQEAGLPLLDLLRQNRPLQGLVLLEQSLDQKGLNEEELLRYLKGDLLSQGSATTLAVWGGEGALGPLHAPLPPALRIHKPLPGLVTPP